VCLAEGGTESGVLDPKLVNEGPTFLPATVGLICRCKGGVEELGSRLERFDVLVSALSECALGLSVLLGAFSGAQGSLVAVGWWGLGLLLLRLLLLDGKSWVGGRGHASWSVVCGCIRIAWGQRSRHGVHESVWGR